MSLLTPKPKPKKAVTAKRAPVPILPVIEDSKAHANRSSGGLDYKDRSAALAYLAAAPKKILKEIVQHYNEGQLAIDAYVKAPSKLSREELFDVINNAYDLRYNKEQAAKKPRSNGPRFEWGLEQFDEDFNKVTYDPGGLHAITSKWFYKPPRKKRVSKKK
jgi:hypothetical protein